MTRGASDVCWMRQSSAMARARARNSMLRQPNCQRRTACRIISAPPPHTQISTGSSKIELKRVAPGSTSARSGARIISERPGAALLQIETRGDMLINRMLHKLTAVLNHKCSNFHGATEAGMLLAQRPRHRASGWRSRNLQQEGGPGHRPKG